MWSVCESYQTLSCDLTGRTLMLFPLVVVSPCIPPSLPCSASHSSFACVCLWDDVSTGDRLLVSCSDHCHYMYRTAALHQGPQALFDLGVRQLMEGKFPPSPPHSTHLIKRAGWSSMYAPNAMPGCRPSLHRTAVLWPYFAAGVGTHASAHVECIQSAFHHQASFIVCSSGLTATCLSKQAPEHPPTLLCPLPFPATWQQRLLCQSHIQSRRRAHSQRINRQPCPHMAGLQTPACLRGRLPVALTTPLHSLNETQKSIFGV